ncbi:mutagen-sensitive 101 [Carabus blaptoides fortunei]
MSKDNIKVYFVLPVNCEDELSTSEQMQTAFELCRQNQIVPDWIRESTCTSSDFRKKDVLVFDKFEGEIFKQLQSLKCLIAGPWCIITCLLEGLPVPNNKSPVFSMAMNKLTVTASNFTADQKKQIKEKIEMMGGVFSLHITQSVTHLVTNCVKTQKYTIANERNMKVMLDTWVEAVWRASLTRNVKADDEEFAVHKCPVFKNLHVSCTGIDTRERTKLQCLITDNGGFYSGKLTVGTTDTLICNPGIHSDKLGVALRYKIPCVNLQWVYDSIEKGYAIREDNYSVQTRSSTPTMDAAPIHPDFSMMSNISAADHVERTSVSETIGNMSLFNLTTTSKHHKESQKENRVPDLLDDIDLKQVKQAGTFLDGCGVYLTGFTPNRREKLCRILKSAGATRYDDITDRVTQILVGDASTHELRVITSRTAGCLPPMVSTKWLVECIKQRQPVYEEPFAVETNSKALATPSSPLSKKGLTLLKHDTSVVEPEVPKFVEPEPFNEEAASMRMYMQPNMSNRDEDTLAQLLAHGNIDSKIDGNQSVHPENPTEEQQNETGEVSAMEEDTIYPVLEGKTFKLVGYTDEEREKVHVIVEELGGTVVPHSYKGITDYAVAPTICSQVRHTATEIVNDLWVLDCHNKNQLLDVEYYHQPFYVTHDDKPLKDCVITFSGYTSYERTYLTLLLGHLGAVYQDRFARITLPDRSVQGSTHLVCLEPAGSKYMAAVRWNRPAVTHHWLLQCAERAELLDEAQFSLEKATDAVAPETNKSNEPVTPQTPSVKRDSVGRKVSPIASNEQPPQTPTAADTETTEKKFKPVEDNTATPVQIEAPPSLFKGFTITNEAVRNIDPKLLASADPLITLEDGTKILLSNFMQDLRDQGLFDTPSPLPVFTRPYREAGLATNKDSTPKRNIATEFTDAEAGCSQGTPVGKYIRDLKERNVLPSTPKHLSTPDSPMPRPFFDVATPDTPLGQFLEENPSRETRKYFQRAIDRFKDYEPARPRLPSTPWSEVKRQAWAWLLRDKSAEQKNPVAKNLSDEMEDNPAEKDVEETVALPAEVEEPEPTPVQAKTDKQSEVRVAVQDDSDTQVEVSSHIGHLQNLLSSRESSSRSSLSGEKATPQKSNEMEDDAPNATKAVAGDSQDDYIEWAEPMEGVEHTSSENTTEFQLRKFMLSGLEQTVRSSCHTAIKSLGGEVSELSHYDASATHVICSNPTRNEKILSSMAAGKWIVHVSYVQASVEASKFVDEEEYEFGNAKSALNLSGLVANTSIVESLHWWRIRIQEQEHGAFHGMRALVFSKNKPALVRLIEAGGGVVVSANPPYTHSVDATHCFVDMKLRMATADFVPLAEQGIPCLTVLYLSNYLNTRTNCTMKDFYIPDLEHYYN